MGCGVTVSNGEGFIEKKPRSQETKKNWALGRNAERRLCLSLVASTFQRWL